MAARLGMTKEALSYLRKAGTIDLADNMGNAAGGVHAASLGGLWQLLVMGFAGVRAWEAGLFVNPKLPARWRRLEFSLTWRGAWLDFDIKRNRSMAITVSGVEGLEVEVGVFERPTRMMRTQARYVSNWTGEEWTDFVEATAGDKEEDEAEEEGG